MTIAEVSTSNGKALRNKPFRTVRVAAVQPLCEDAAAITFAIPDEYAGEFAFTAGQSITVRRTVAGSEQRRSYSICSPTGALPRIGVREVPGEPSRAGWCTGCVQEMRSTSSHLRAALPQTPTWRRATCLLLRAQGSRRCCRSRRRSWPIRMRKSRCSTAIGGQTP